MTGTQINTSRENMATLLSTEEIAASVPAHVLDFPAGKNIAELKKSVLESINFENALEVLLVLTVAEKRWVNEYTSTKEGIVRIIAKMEGNYDSFLELCKVFQEANCRGCSLPSGKELAKIGTGEKCCYHDVEMSQGGTCEYRSRG
jgi:NRPS condensation-like uncharacterized protein